MTVHMNRERVSSVYILASRRNGTLYVGVTNNLVRRIYEHKNKFQYSFSKKYHIDKLVYYECFNSITDAIHREKQIKHYQRAEKIILIEGFNPGWKDLYQEIV